MKKILHVSESYGGGVAYVIQKIVEESPSGFKHFLLINERDSIGNIEHLKSLGCKISFLKPGFISQFLSIRKKGISNSFDVIHAHSSIAGGLVRLALPFSEKVLYTPHCYSFERLDYNFFTRFFFYFIEQLLSFLGGRYSACGNHELALCKKMKGAKSCKLLRNVVDISSASEGLSVLKNKDRCVVAAAGRICQQKGVDYFLSFIEKVRNHDPERYSFFWIGGGEKLYEEKLISCGVTITGFLNREDFLASLSDVDIYIHTAEWEGFPVQLLEASALGCDVLIRSIPAVDYIEGVVTAREVNELYSQFCLIDKISKKNHLELNKLNDVNEFRKRLKYLY